MKKKFVHMCQFVCVCVCVNILLAEWNNTVKTMITWYQFSGFEITYKLGSRAFVWRDLTTK
jgi:hypothetical protein